MIPVIDVFAGPGGLNEGFSSVKDDNGTLVFETVASFEMESSAVQTLRLRSAFRHARRFGCSEAQQALDDYLNKQITFEVLIRATPFSASYQHACREVHELELSPETRTRSDKIISEALGKRTEPWVLIGGPPCQAYSLAGRSRRTHDETFEDDHKHFLYREYLHIIQEHRPTVFVMENVKGLLSSVNRGVRMFDLICKDLQHPTTDLEYTLHSMVVQKDDSFTPEDYLIRAEDYGIPQKRHRIIIVGILKGSGIPSPGVLSPAPQLTVGEAISDLPPLRSRVSRENDPFGLLWKQTLNVVDEYLDDDSSKICYYKNLTTHSTASPTKRPISDNPSVTKYFNFVRPEDSAYRVTWNHESRAHMLTDLVRYGVLSAKSKIAGKSLKIKDLDDRHWPAHKNIDSKVVPFADRFRVQVENSPATTIVSHIAKDGHYYIHPDPSQMRSLTVREAARLQTFPDDYVFLGSRTQQFTQVGNAVPPLLAQMIGREICLAINRAEESYIDEVHPDERTRNKCAIETYCDSEYFEVSLASQLPARATPTGEASSCTSTRVRLAENSAAGLNPSETRNSVL